MHRWSFGRLHRPCHPWCHPKWTLWHGHQEGSACRTGHPWETVKRYYPSSSLSTVSSFQKKKEFLPNTVTIPSQADRAEEVIRLDCHNTFKVFAEGAQGWIKRSHQTKVDCYRANRRNNHTLLGPLPRWMLREPSTTAIQHPPLLMLHARAHSEEQYHNAPLSCYSLAGLRTTLKWRIPSSGRKTQARGKSLQGHVFSNRKAQWENKLLMNILRAWGLYELSAATAYSSSLAHPL